MVEFVELFRNDNFKRAIEAYRIASRKTIAEVINKQAINVVYTASAETPPQTDKNTAAKRIEMKLRLLPITKDNGRRRYGDTRLVGALKLMNWQRKNLGLVTVGNGAFAKTKSGNISKKRLRQGRLTEGGGRLNRFADGKLLKFIKARANSTKFIALGWAAAAAALGKPFTRSRTGDFDEATLARLGGAIKAVPSINPFALIINRAGSRDIRFKGRPQRMISGAVKVGTDALKRAIDIVSQRIMDDIAKGLVGNARRINVK